MKYATKLMVVPYQPRIDNPTQTHIFKLEEQMRSVMDDPSLKPDDKVKLYNQALGRYTKSVDDYNLSNATADSNYVNNMSSNIASATYDKFKDDMAILKEIQPSPSSNIYNNIDKRTLNLNKTTRILKQKNRRRVVQPSNADDVGVEDIADEQPTNTSLNLVTPNVTLHQPNKQTYDEPQPGDNSLFDLQQHDSGAYFIIPKSANNKKELLERWSRTNPNGVDPNKINSMNIDSAIKDLEFMVGKAGDRQSEQTKARNLWFANQNTSVLYRADKTAALVQHYAKTRQGARKPSSNLPLDGIQKANGIKVWKFKKFMR